MKLYQMLTYAGALPFLACALALIAGIEDLPRLGATADVMTLYGLVITAFMAGTHWGLYLNGGAAAALKLNLFIISNVITIAAWLAYMLSPPSWVLGIFIPGFSLLLWVDEAMFRQRLLTSTYIRTRRIVTATVCLCFMTAAIIYD